MSLELPLNDSFIDGAAPLYEPGSISITQCTLEQVMLRDFPTVAALGIEAYATRLLDVEYTDGTRVFYLDWNPPLPGFTVLYLEPWTTSIGEGGIVSTHVRYYTGLEAAKRAEQIRRLIPPGELHS